MYYVLEWIIRAESDIIVSDHILLSLFLFLLLILTLINIANSLYYAQTIVDV